VHIIQVVIFTVIGNVEIKGLNPGADNDPAHPHDSLSTLKTDAVRTEFRRFPGEKFLFKMTGEYMGQIISTRGDSSSTSRPVPVRYRPLAP
jgi:hypothetical protein